MTTKRDAHLSDLLCHCSAAPTGHPLTTVPGCDSFLLQIKPGTYPSRSGALSPTWTPDELYSALAKTAPRSERKYFRQRATMARDARKEWVRQGGTPR